VYFIIMLTFPSIFMSECGQLFVLICRISLFESDCTPGPRAEYFVGRILFNAY
jgi:hypothetical protein